MITERTKKMTVLPCDSRRMRQLERERRLAEEHAEDLQLKLKVPILLLG